MAYESVAVTPGTGKDVAVDTVDGKEIQIVKLDVGADGVSDPVVGALPVDVTGQGDVPITLDGEQVTVNLGATDNAVLDTIATNTGESLTDTELRAAPVPVSGTVAPYAQPANFVSGATADITDTTATSVIAAQGAGVKIYLTTLMVSNSDADTGTVVKITDGSGGTTMWSGYAAALGGGYVVNFNIPLVFTTAVFAQCETTDATVRVNAAGYMVVAPI